MANRCDRRDILKGVGALCAAHFLGPSKREAAPQSLQIASRNVEAQLAPVSAHTFRLSVLPLEGAQPQSVKGNGSLVQASWGPLPAQFVGGLGEHAVNARRLNVHLACNPPHALVENSNDAVAPALLIDSGTGAVAFSIRAAALLGVGEGGPQFVRRGSKD